MTNSGMRNSGMGDIGDTGSGAGDAATTRGRRGRAAWALGAILVLALGLSACASGGPEHLTVEVLAQHPHDPQAFTQGLLLSGGKLYESTGLVGRSSLREVDPSTGAVLRQRDIPGPTFSEGLALVDGTLVQLSWKAGTAFRWARTTFNPEGTFAYDGEGWGLCFDGTELIMSDGSATLTRRDPSTFAVLGRVEVRNRGAPVPRLNELECVGDEVYANVWLTDEIVRIDPRSGRVTATIDASPLRRAMPTLTDQNAVLNGIAYDAATGHLLLTGKLWPSLFEVDLKPAGD